MLSTDLFAQICHVNRVRAKGLPASKKEPAHVCACCGGTTLTAAGEPMRTSVLFCENDACRAEYHMLCVGLNAVPVGAWRCPACVPRTATAEAAPSAPVLPTEGSLPPQEPAPTRQDAVPEDAPPPPRPKVYAPPTAGFSSSESDDDDDDEGMVVESAAAAEARALAANPAAIREAYAREPRHDGDRPAEDAAEREAVRKCSSHRGGTRSKPCEVRRVGDKTYTRYESVSAAAAAFPETTGLSGSQFISELLNRPSRAPVAVLTALDARWPNPGVDDNSVPVAIQEARRALSEEEIKNGRRPRFVRNCRRSAKADQRKRERFEEAWRSVKADRPSDVVDERPVAAVLGELGEDMVRTVHVAAQTRAGWDASALYSFQAALRRQTGTVRHGFKDLLKSMRSGEVSERQGRRSIMPAGVL